MNKRRKKKKGKRSFVWADEYNLLTMNEDELEEAHKNYCNYARMYGYRKKYNSKSRVKTYYCSPGKEYTENMTKWFSVTRRDKIETTVIKQDLNQIISMYENKSEAKG